MNGDPVSVRSQWRVCAWIMGVSLLVTAGCEGTGALAKRPTATVASAPTGAASPQTPTPLAQPPRTPSPALQAPSPQTSSPVPQAPSPQTPNPAPQAPSSQTSSPEVSASPPSTSPNAGPGVAFRAPVSAFPSTASVIKGKKPDEIIEIVLPGRMYDPPMKLEPVAARSQADRRTPEQASASDFSAMRTGDSEWIKENYTSEDYPSIQRLVEDPNMRKMNQGVFMRHESKTVVASCLYKGYALLFVQYDNTKATGLVETYARVGPIWKRTNALSNDETAAVVLFLFRNGEVASIPQ